MREIKFRGKIKYNGKHRFSGQWVYGYYWYSETEEKHYIKESEDVDGLGTFLHEDFEVIPESVGQLIQIKNKEFYEEDLVLFKGNNSPLVVRLDDFCVPCFVDVKSGNCWDFAFVGAETFEHEIIGNTTDNPELSK